MICKVLTTSKEVDKCIDMSPGIKQGNSDKSSSIGNCDMFAHRRTNQNYGYLAVPTVAIFSAGRAQDAGLWTIAD
jgi:hypothetical protein